MSSRDRIRLGWCSLVVAMFSAHAASAQGGNIDIISGTVTDAGGKPVPGARVTALSIETDVTRQTTTKPNGQYILFFNDGGGEYRVTVTAIGHTPYIVNVTRQSDDDRIDLDVRLGDQAVRLQDVVAVGNRRPNLDALNVPTPGSTERNITGEEAMRLPIDASDLSALAALAPGVIFTEGTDSTASSFQVAGQSAESNSYLVNGMTSSSTSVPQDAVRSTRVITNSYDVARGGFAGGQVLVTTKGGSNRVSGSLSSRFQNPDLSWGETSSSVFNQGQTREQVGAGFGGPIQRNKLFLFGSMQLNRTLAPEPSLDLANNVQLTELGIAPDSAAEFISLVDATGLSTRAGTIDPNRTSDQFQSLNRLDWNAGQVHIVTVTGGLGVNSQDPTRVGSSQLPQVGGNSSGSSANLSVQVASRLGRWINQFRGGYSYNDTRAEPFLDVPVGRVTNQSTLDSGLIAVSTLGFGGNSGLPQHNNTGTSEATDEISVLAGSRLTHRVALGLYAIDQHFNQDATNNRYGTYTYPSLAAFAANDPSSFTRTLQPTIRSGSVFNQALYLEDIWRPRPANAGRAGRAGGGGGGGGFGGGRGGRGGGRGGGGGGVGTGGGGNFQLVAGVRVEHTSYSGAPALNQPLFDEFGVRTDRLPSQLSVTPRVGFSYSIAAPEQQGQSQRGFAPPLLTIRGGAGIFRGTMPATLPGTAQAQSGLSTAQTQINCVGDAVPLPDWSEFAADPSTIPTECLDNTSTPIITGRPTVTVYDHGYGAPQTDRVSLGLTRRLTTRITFNADASYVRGTGQAASRDLNLNETPRFRLGGADGRPVYADPTQIVAATGQVPLSASRIDPDFGAVHNVFSALENQTRQLTFNVTGTTNRQMQLNLAYTLMYARDEGGAGGRFGASTNETAGDPNVYTWAPSSNERRHNIQATVSWPITPAFELTTVARITSGSHYTPIVAGDINGDGSARDDRAFVYTAATTTDTAVANGMTRLLAETSGNARKCLEAQLDRIAGRNTCTGPWTPSLELQVNWRPGLFNRRMAVSFQTQNLLGGLDEWINGPNDLKGWGGNTRPDNTLLTVDGFDPATNQFDYVVNARFGNTSSAATAIRRPFQLSVNVRLAIGYDQRTLQIQSLGRGAGPTPQQQVQQYIARLEAENIAKAVLARKDSLALSPDQLRALQHLSDSADQVINPLLAALDSEATRAAAAQSAADYNALIARIQPVTRGYLALADAVRLILTPEQWALLPESVRNPRSAGGVFGGGRRGGGGGGGRGGFGGGRAAAGLAARRAGGGSPLLPGHAPIQNGDREAFRIVPAEGLEYA